MVSKFKTLVTEAVLEGFVQQAPADVSRQLAAPVLAVPQLIGTDAVSFPLVRHYASATSHTASTLQAALQAYGGNQSRAAQSLGLTVRQYSYRLRKAGPALKS